MIILSDSDNAEKLVISFKFPPDKDISGIVVAKRIIKDNSVVDVLQNAQDDDSYNFDEVNDFINERLYVSVDSERDSVECIFNFVNQGLELIDDREYKEIYSRSWYMSNHYLALEYKFNHPDTFWVAEFSDPVLLNMKGKIKTHKLSVLNDEGYIEKLNLRIDEYNAQHSTDFDKLDNPNNSFYIAEYLTFLFADRIIFTNENQRETMLSTHDDEIGKLAVEKSEIMPHPTLDDKYYHLAETSFELKEGDINLAYFGNSYYPSRHFEPLFFAFESLNHRYKDKIKFHLFIKKDEFIDALIDDLEFRDNIIINDPLDYFEFLNATLKFDVLLINDTLTEGFFPHNPYLPSKLSDYLGSGRDIWAIYEKNSTLSTLDLKYKSLLTDYKQSREVLLNILNDYGYADDEFSFDDSFYEKRINQLNRMIFDREMSNKQKNIKIKQLNNKNKKLNEENKKLLSSKSWKTTAPLRKMMSFFR